MGTLKVDNIQSSTDGSVTLPQGTILPSGSASTPSVSFSGNTNTGIYKIVDNAIGISTGGTLRTRIDNNGLEVIDGSASTPSISFLNSSTTGLYRIGANTIGIASNGTRVGEIGNGYGGFTGNIIQVAYAELTTSGVSSSVITIPGDNTTPQQTEGAEILTCSITPRYANSILYIESNSFLGENTNVWDTIGVALFRDSNLDAISTSFANSNGVTAAPWGGVNFNPIYILGRVISGSTNTTTFKLRGNGTSGTVSTTGAIRWNGAGGAQYYNGTLITYIRILEVQV